LKDFLLTVVPIVSVELLAALTGLYFLFRAKKKIETPIRFFIFFLCLTVVVEITGTYSPIAYFTDYEYFGFIKNTWLEKNFWIYNIYSIISFAVYISFFLWYLTNRNQKKIGYALLVVYIITCIVNLVLSDVFLNAFSSYTEVVGSILILFAIILYYFQMLYSDAILNYTKMLPFYISLGAMLLSFVLTPLVIYGRHFDVDRSPEFVELYKTLLVGTNVLVYLIYTIGFIICLKKKDS